MPSVRGIHNGRAAIIPVAVIDAARYRNHKRAEEPLVRGVRQVRGLIDTGATTTMVSARFARELGLVPAGRTMVSGLGGDQWRTAYLFHVAFPDGFVQWDDPWTEQGSMVDRYQVCRTLIEGGELTHEASFDVLIGMDIITTGDLHVRRDGSFTFNF